MAAEFKDVICEVLHHRIEELLPLDPYKIWFLVKGTSDPELATVLGYDREFFEDMLKHSALTGPKYWLISKWGDLLGHAWE
jgi:hypothetical protein